MRVPSGGPKAPHLISAQIGGGLLPKREPIANPFPDGWIPPLRVKKAVGPRLYPQTQRALRCGLANLLRGQLPERLRNMLPKEVRGCTFVEVPLAIELLLLARREPESEQGGRVLRALAGQGSVVAPMGSGNNIPGIGDMQNTWVELLREEAPDLLRAAVAEMPEIKAEMKALWATARSLKKQYGRFLEGFNVAITSHILAEAPGFAEVLEYLGALPSDTIWMGVSYSSNEIAVEGLRARGHFAHIPHGKEGREERRWGKTVDANTAFRNAQSLPSFHQLKEAQFKALFERLVRKSGGNGKPVLVVDDGGYGAGFLQANFPKDTWRFAFVEQTSRGSRKLRELKGFTNVAVNVGECRPKKEIESPFVADAVRDAVRISVGDIKDANVGVLGVGAIGGAMCEEGVKAGSRVRAYDPSAEGRARMQALGLEVNHSKLDVIRHADHLMGATGLPNMDHQEFMSIKGGAKLYSLSSVDIEYLDSWQWAQTVAQVLEEAIPHIHNQDPMRSRGPRGSRSARRSKASSRYDNVEFNVKVDLPGSRLHGSMLSESQKASNFATRSFEEGLHESLERHMVGKGVKVTVNATMGHIDIASKILDLMYSHDPWAREALSGTLGSSRMEIAEAMIENRAGREPVWLVNGGYPVNLSRRLVSMPAERIQVTLQSLLAGCAQATKLHKAGERPGLVDLDESLQCLVENDFAKHGPKA